MRKKRWSKLQAALYAIIDADMGFQMHCCAYPPRSKSGYCQNPLPRFWISINGRIAWDFPKACDEIGPGGLDPFWFPNQPQYDISGCIRAYIDCPRSSLLEFGAGKNWWGLVPLLKACDRRISKRKRMEIAKASPGLEWIFVKL